MRYCRNAFVHLFDLEKEMIGLCDKMADCTPEEMDEYLKDVGEIQDILDHSGFYTIDVKVNEVASGLGLNEKIGLDQDVSQLSGGQRSKVLLSKLLLENPMILILDARRII